MPLKASEWPGIDEYEIKQIVKSKRKLVAWFVTNCVSASGREGYVKELQKHIKVDIYGKCGTIKCHKATSEKCNEMIEPYKFYLAFENSFCADYITEKVWKSLLYGIVPVVMGGADYKNYLPKHSYIDVADFKSPKHLADYLTLLDRDDAMYSEYFKWRRAFKAWSKPGSYSPEDIGFEFCFLCVYAHRNPRHAHSNPRPATHTHEHLSQWWNKTTDCRGPRNWPDPAIQRLIAAASKAKITFPPLFNPDTHFA